MLENSGLEIVGRLPLTSGTRPKANVNAIGLCSKCRSRLWTGVAIDMQLRRLSRRSWPSFMLVCLR
jgi:hypothetical protein